MLSSKELSPLVLIICWGNVQFQVVWLKRHIRGFPYIVTNFKTNGIGEYCLVVHFNPYNISSFYHFYIYYEK